MTDYPLRVTVVCPEALLPDARQMALVLGNSAADVATFREGWVDADGNPYGVASFLARATFPTSAGSPFAAPDFAPDVDLEAAGRAQAALRIFDPESPFPASPSILWAGLHDSDQDAIAAAGISRAGEAN